MTKSISFEKSIKELEEIVYLLEKGDLSLDESLKQFEKGVSLARMCQEKLATAEQKIEILANPLNNSTDEINNE